MRRLATAACAIVQVVCAWGLPSQFRVTKSESEKPGAAKGGCATPDAPHAVVSATAFPKICSRLVLPRTNRIEIGAFAG